jgi:hypothetical protein
LTFEHSGDTYALKEVKSDLLDLSFRTKVPHEVTANLASSAEVEVAMNRE